ncbi:MAG: hypothetical protein A3A33_01830 [Candidatus Yanofskybacteria bacterium RIFCSPLOWO2_01_FULL_49_25]|uniref:Uncharacterized protein n=1 Tax=Candidatus Yanofskybacteria bacterium RIFCSPLOWO2_01_FULL_49_25 TaxID=1802701 RepID=A0A1F8GU79_9BACT|nr:MAG: hypothetical protein A3A33_01830 [Candidatus Yanofskybacteria bacterium RIFCSPLOWO2_01_FULL_49_25]
MENKNKTTELTADNPTFANRTVEQVGTLGVLLPLARPLENGDETDTVGVMLEIVTNTTIAEKLECVFKLVCIVDPYRDRVDGIPLTRVADQFGEQALAPKFKPIRIFTELEAGIPEVIERDIDDPLANVDLVGIGDIRVHRPEFRDRMVGLAGDTDQRIARLDGVHRRRSERRHQQEKADENADDGGAHGNPPQSPRDRAVMLAYQYKK